MYEPPHFREADATRQHALIRAFPLGLLITAGVVAGLQGEPAPFASAMADLVAGRDATS